MKTAKFIGWQSLPGREPIPFYNWELADGSGQTTGDANGAVRAGCSVEPPDAPMPEQDAPSRFRSIEDDAGGDPAFAQ